MTVPPDWIDDLTQDIVMDGRERQEHDAIGWSVEMDYLYEIDDDQPRTMGAKTGDLYRSSDSDLSFEYIGASYYLDLEGGPLEHADHDYGLWFEIIRGKPRVSLETDLELWDADPLYHAVESVLDDYDFAAVVDKRPTV